MKNIAVWFSCGAASAVAAKLTLEKYGKSHNVRVLNNPIAEEDSDNTRFLEDVQKWLGVTIEKVVNPNYPSQSCVDVWGSERFMSSPWGAVCTRLLKKKARELWENNNPVDYHVLGFTAEEKTRSDNFALTERPNILPVLIDAGMTKQMCLDSLLSAGVQPPRMYSLGFPNANCVGCVKASSPTYWNHVRKVFPEVFEERAKQSRELGARLVTVKGKRIFLDELSPTAKGHPLKSLKISCGLFCEEGVI